VPSDLPPVPPASGSDVRRGTTYQPSAAEIDLVNAALYLRRPLLITGKPGTGKSSLIYAVARELKLGQVLSWSVTSRSTLQDALYRYDAIARLHARQFDDDENSARDIGKYIRLGPLGTALIPSNRPRALLIDEIDKSDIDLPNDLLNVFEEGSFEIPELVRLPESQSTVSVMTHDSGVRVPIDHGKVQCREFPFVVLTSNGEREFPPPFLRRCVRLDIPVPEADKLSAIVEAHLKDNLLPDDDTDLWPQAKALIDEYLELRKTTDLATDQLLNAIFMVTKSSQLAASRDARQDLTDALLRGLTNTSTA
jgi:MoxR-like ATPase